jgi:hypothetical protein
MPTKIKTPQDNMVENMVSRLVDLYIQGHKAEIEKAKTQIEYWEDVIEREENYITYLYSFNNL